MGNTPLVDGGLGDMSHVLIGVIGRRLEGRGPSAGRARGESPPTTPTSARNV
jgi:hypothetical protein